MNVDWKMYLLFAIEWFIIVMVCLFLAEIISQAASPDDVAVDFAIATMMTNVAPDPAPSPSPNECSNCGGAGWITHGDGHKTPCPKCSPQVGGPLSIIRDAKELVRKGNDLANRGKSLLDAIDRDGKITVDVRLPVRSSTIVVPVEAAVVSPQKFTQPSCVDGKCSYRSSPKKESSWRWQRR